MSVRPCCVRRFLIVKRKHSFQTRQYKTSTHDCQCTFVRTRTNVVDLIFPFSLSKMAAVRLYVTLALLLLATCFHSSEGWWRRRRRRGCSRVNCQWSAWSSWGSCNYHCRSGSLVCLRTFKRYKLISIS